MITAHCDGRGCPQCSKPTHLRLAFGPIGLRYGTATAVGMFAADLKAMSLPRALVLELNLAHACRTEAMIKSGKVPDVSMRRCQSNYKKALEKGVLKILSKMGISLLSCYHGAQILRSTAWARRWSTSPSRAASAASAACPSATCRRRPSPSGSRYPQHKASCASQIVCCQPQRRADQCWPIGLGQCFFALSWHCNQHRQHSSFVGPVTDHSACHVQGFPEKAMNKLEDFGFIQSRPKGEYHANNQQMSKLLHKAIGLGNKGAAHR